MTGTNTTEIADIPDVIDGPANNVCEGSDSVYFPPADVLCPNQGTRPVTLNISPFIVFVDNRGIGSNGFHFRYNYQPC